MKLIILVCVLVIVFYSCAKGPGEDPIHLSKRTVEFKASGDSVTISIGGSSWWIDDISVDDKWYFDFTNIDQIYTESYSIQQDCFDVERRDKNTLFIKITANNNSVRRIITVGLSAGDYHERVTITQNSN
jgi:hypothetical protein